MLDDVLRNGFDQRIIRHGLYENRAVSVLRRRRHIDLQRQRGPFLQKPVVNVLNRLEPGQARVMNVMRLVVQHHQLVDVADDHAEVPWSFSSIAT